MIHNWPNTINNDQKNLTIARTKDQLRKTINHKDWSSSRSDQRSTIMDIHISKIKDKWPFKSCSPKEQCIFKCVLSCAFMHFFSIENEILKRKQRRGLCDMAARQLEKRNVMWLWLQEIASLGIYGGIVANK